MPGRGGLRGVRAGGQHGQPWNISSCPGRGGLGLGGARAPCNSVAISSGSVTALTMRMGPWHFAQTRTSTRNTLAKSFAQAMREGLGVLEVLGQARSVGGGKQGVALGHEQPELLIRGTLPRVRRGDGAMQAVTTGHHAVGA
jgi:hypothetical protein